MTKQSHDSRAEKLIFNYLPELIDTDSYYIRSHVALYDVFDELQPYKNNAVFEKFCELNGTQAFSDRRSELAHFDFVIYSDATDMPALIIEVNGTSHEKYPARKNMDHFKQFICNKNGIPLVVLKLYKSYEDDEIQDMLRVFLEPCHSRYGFAVHCDKCKTIMNLKQNRTDDSFFYACSNPDCKGDTDSPKPWTVSAEYIPILLKES